MEIQSSCEKEEVRQMMTIVKDVRSMKMMKGADDDVNGCGPPEVDTQQPLRYVAIENEVCGMVEDKAECETKKASLGNKITAFILKCRL